MLNLSLNNLSHSVYGRLAGHLQSPLYRNGYALVLSTILTSGLGVFYWMLAAQLYSAEVVGLNAGLIATMNFISYLAQLNLNNAINRFLPGAGGGMRKFLVYAYIITIVLGLVGSLLYLFQIEWWTPLLSAIKTQPWLCAWFVLSTISWSIVGLQDSALTGLRQATWVPIEQSVFALLKIILLVALAALSPAWGIFVSWTLAFFLLPLPINFLLFRRLIPRHLRTARPPAEPITARQILHFLGGDYLASLLWIATTSLLPVLVLERAGAAASAYFYLSWTLAWPLYLVSRNMGMSLITEGVLQQTHLNRYSYQIIQRTAMLLTPIVLIILVTAPYLLQFFGQNYAKEGTLLLRLLALTALPYIITAAYVSIARIQRRLVALFIVQAAPCVVVLLLGSLLLERYGAVGIGVAWAIGHLIVAVVLATTVLRSLWLEQFDVQQWLHWTVSLHQVWQRWHSQRQIAQAQQYLPEIVAVTAAKQKETTICDWQIHSHIPTLGDVNVFRLGQPGEQPATILKLSHSPKANSNLLHHCLILKQLQTDRRLAEWRALMPQVIANGVTNGQVYCVEEMKPGLTAQQLWTQPTKRSRMLFVALQTIAHFHQQTGSWQPFADTYLSRWIDQPCLRLQRVLAARQPASAQHLAAIERLRGELQQALAGKQLFTSWVHGDFSLGNLLLSPTDDSVTGVIDWELSADCALPEIDHYLMLISSRMQGQRREFGAVVLGLLQGETWNEAERNALTSAVTLHPSNPLAERTLILLTWLHHVSQNRTQPTWLACHSFWLAKNVYPVLNSL